MKRNRHCETLRAAAAQSRGNLLGLVGIDNLISQAHKDRHSAAPLTLAALRDDGGPGLHGHY